MISKVIILLLCTHIIKATTLNSTDDDPNKIKINILEELKSRFINKAKEIFSSQIDPPERVRTVEELNKRSDEYVVLDFFGLVEQYGYTAEEYTVTTDDGYILKLHRITGSPSSPKADGKPVVYVMHCLFASSDFTVSTGLNHSLVLELADAGYDVWIGNARGNSYSKAHVKYSTASEEFWDFAMDELALQDLPKFIDFALEKTNQSKLTYIGFSMGTTLGYMLLSARPEYNDKINLQISYAPTVYFSQPRNVIFAVGVGGVVTFAEEAELNEVLPQTVALQKLTNAFCSFKVLNVCKAILTTAAKSLKIKSDLIPGMFKYYPAGTSYYVMKQYQQLSTYDRKFQRFQRFCSTSPCEAQDSLEYDLSSITVPQAIYYGSEDFVANAEDVKYLETKLKNVLVFREIPFFNHVDFAMHEDLNRLVHYDILDVIQKNI